MPEDLPLAIIGGGPAGALLAHDLAVAGRNAVIVEERPGWEKPCGGGLTDKALRRYPFLSGEGCDHNWVEECELASPAGRRLLLRLDRKLAIVSRHGLNSLLLDRARSAGARVVADRVVGCSAQTAHWVLRLRSGGEIRAAAVCNASGARNPVAALPGPLRAGDWMATAGYYVPAAALPWPPKRLIVQFLAGVEGYIWSFPRAGHASIGICCRLGAGPASEPPVTTASQRRRLETWLDARRVAWRGSPFYAHLLPAPTAGALERARLASAEPLPWALAGDAAGLVDPITGEGLYYALRSAELLAAQVSAAGPAAGRGLAGAMEAYHAALRRELLPELLAAARIAPRFYHGNFLGASVLERMMQFGRRSSRFRELLCDLFSGAQGYTGLRSRLYRNLGFSLAQMASPRTARAQP